MTDDDGAPGRGHLHTTTVRFDADTWELILEHCHRLGIAHAEFIRGAVQWRLGGVLYAERLALLEGRVEAHGIQLGKVARVVARVARRARVGPSFEHARYVAAVPNFELFRHGRNRAMSGTAAHGISF